MDINCGTPNRQTRSQEKCMQHNSAIVFENGTIIGAVTDSVPNSTLTTTMSSHSNNNTIAKITRKQLIIPEIVISASQSNSSLNQSRCDIDSTNSMANSDESAVESTALLESQPDDIDVLTSIEHPDEAFEEFVLNRTTSDTNILESSIYSELQFPPSINGSGSGGSTANPLPNAPQDTAPGQTTTASDSTATVVDMLNSSACSRESRQSAKQRSRRKHKSKTKCNPTSAAATTQHATPVLSTNYPPQYTAIFLDPHSHHHHPYHGGAANAMGQIASAAASSPFLNAPTTDAASYLQQQYQYYQQRPLMSGLGAMGHHHHHRSLLDPIAPISATDGVAINPPGNGSTPVSPTTVINPTLRLNFRKWFSRPSLPFVIGILALGGVACTLGGIVLGSTGLIEHSTQYLSAALLMIGIGVSLLVISGAIWRLSMPDTDPDECPCYRHMETCRNCNSPFCNNRLIPGNYFYPEFQHRPPPPSYLTSLNECAAMGFIFNPSGQAQPTGYSTMRVNTPPPLYRSTNSLSSFNPVTVSGQSSTQPVGTALNALPVTVHNSSGGILPDQNVLNAMSVVMENLQAQTQTLTKEINYLELD